MPWVIFSILAALFSGIALTIDKYVVSKVVKNPFAVTCILGVISLISALLIYLFIVFSALEFHHIIFAFVGGIFYILFYLSYFKAAQIEEISRIVPLLSLAPLFVLVLATIFLGEIFTPEKYLGIFLLVIGAIIISSKKLKISFGKAFWLTVFASFSLSITFVITKYLLNFTDFWTVFAYTRIGEIFVLIPLLYFTFSDLVRTMEGQKMKVIGLMTAEEFFYLSSMLFVTIASAIGPVTLVTALSSIHPFFVLLFAVVLSIFYPWIIKEEIRKRTLSVKLIAIILIFIGVVFITS